MRIYHLGALFLIFLCLGGSIGYSIGRTEIFALVGFILGVVPIIFYRRAVIKKEKISREEKDKTSYI
ncbi:hypothetical protein [Oceanobacillus sp. CFH 90083]|uniref:hypothetical protein n=1 Tax=Oceanobacillus sp. CFH 90083 TaxID=2592336 RepID=UPI00128E7092|nr:hypothetical protein [Oceanobacillus sp. CFH 90083]